MQETIVAEIKTLPQLEKKKNSEQSDRTKAITKIRQRNFNSRAQSLHACFSKRHKDSVGVVLKSNKSICVT